MKRNPRGKNELYEVTLYIEEEDDLKKWFRCLIMATSKHNAKRQMVEMFSHFLTHAKEQKVRNYVDDPPALKKWSITAQKFKGSKGVRKTGLGRLGYVESYEGDVSWL